MQGLPILMSDMRGSLGGLTASRNRWGDYFRARVSPIQPGTPAQLGAKTAFGASAPAWRSLPPARRQVFNSFAKTAFQPRTKANKGNYTGQLAFSALYTQFINSQRINRAFQVAKNGVVLPGGITTLNFDGPVLSTLSGLLTPVARDGNSWNQLLTLINASLLFDGGVSFEIQMGNGKGYDFVDFNSTSAGIYGFAVYCSSANPIQGMNFRNKEKYLIGFFNPPEFVVPSEGNDAISFTITATDILPIIDYQSFPVGNDWVNLSVYMVSNTNQMKLIGRKEVMVGAI